MARRTYDSARQLHARAGRAAEDPRAMTTDAVMQRLAKHVAVVLKQNPDLTAKQAANAGRLLLRDEMTQLAKRSAAARRGELLDATALADCGSDGIDAA